MPSPTDAIIAATLTALPLVPVDGRFGPDRVFVTALWRQFDRGAFPGLTLDGFKAALLAGNRDGQLTLARCDIRKPADRERIAASEIAHLTATFHFVIDPTRSHL